MRHTNHDHEGATDDRPAGTQSPMQKRPAHRAVLYLRVGGIDQSTGANQALAAQRQACHQKAADIGASVVDEFVDEGFSGYIRERRGLDQLLAYIRRHDVDYIIVHRLDRLSRNMHATAELLKQLDAANVTLVTAHGDAVVAKVIRTTSVRLADTPIGVSR